MNRIQKSLIAAQELGDEKMQVVTQLQEIIDQKTRQLDADFKSLDYGGRDDQARSSSSPKDLRPQSPTAAPSMSNHVKIEIKTEDGSTNPVAATIPVSITERSNVATSSNASTGGSGSNSSNNGGDRAWKRSRRGRELTNVRSNNPSTFNSTTKSSSAIDISSDSIINATASTKGNASGQTSQVNIGASSSAASQNKKQSSAGGKKKKRKSGRSQGISTTGSNNNSSSTNQQSGTRPHEDAPPMEETIDPDEPTYCLCDQISFGEMILCDNDLCPIEWFHFSCVSLTTKPKGKWFCPNCRGERPSVMKPKQQFLKELERYNREKEEKS